MNRAVIKDSDWTVSTSVEQGKHSKGKDNCTGESGGSDAFEEVNEHKVHSSPIVYIHLFINNTHCQLAKGDLEAKPVTKGRSEIAETDITLPLPLCVIKEPCAEGKSDNEIALEKQSFKSKELVVPFLTQTTIAIYF